MIKDPELLKLAIKAIEIDPKRWNQAGWNLTQDLDDGFAVGTGEEFWSDHSRRYLELQDLEHCGTTLCLAGHVTVMAGLLPLAGVEGYGQCIDPTTGEVSHIADKAAELLGLSNDQAEKLFFGGGSNISTYKKLVTEVTGVKFE